MRAAALVMVGSDAAQNASNALPELVATPVFSQHLMIENVPCDTGRYWCDLLEALPADIENALVLRPEIIFTSDIVRLGTLVHGDIVAAVPLALRHDISRPFLSASENLELSVEDINHWLNRYAVGKPVELPILAGFCGWVNVSALRRVAAHSDLELAEILRRQGRSIVLSDEAFVDDAACGKASSIKDALPAEVSVALLERHPYTGLRHPLSQLNKEGKKPPRLLTRGPGAILHISHSWGGGLGRWISDFCTAEDDFLHLVLRSIGTRDTSAQAFALYLGNASEPLKQWTLATPIQSTSLGSYEYRQILGEIQNSFTLRAVVISTLIGHALDIYDLNVPTIQVLHDYYPWCPPLYATWDAPCETCDADRLSRCLKQNSAHRFFGDEKLDWYLTLRDKFLEHITTRVIPVVAPSESVRRRWQQLAPQLQDYPVNVIGHGLPRGELDSFASHRWDTSTDQRLHLVTLGALPEHKGGFLLKAMLPELLRHYRLTLLGVGEEAPTFPRHPELTVIKSYSLPDLPRKLQSLKPDLGLLLSTVPETFSYTLSELHAAAIPVIATKSGAFADRIEDGVTGWFVAPQGDDLVEVLSALDRDREAIARVRLNLLVMEQRATDAVVRDYLNLIAINKSIYALKRPLCRSVVADKGISLDEGEPSQKALFVRPGAAYRLALFQFLLYSHNKTRSSPQLSRFSRLLLSALLRLGMRLSRP